jgi:alpha/beta superfamily hydrolase
MFSSSSNPLVSLTISVENSPIQLEGVWNDAPAGAAVFAPPHPLYGGRLDNPPVLAADAGLHAAGLGTLRFNFRGVGASTGAPTDDSAAADADYRAALARLMQLHRGPYVAVGYSFGAAAALRVAHTVPEIAKVILVAPPLAALDRRALHALADLTAIVLGDDDNYAPLLEMRRTLSDTPNVRLIVVDGADHFFGGAADELTQAVERAAR